MLSTDGEKNFTNIAARLYYKVPRYAQDVRVNESEIAFN